MLTFPITKDEIDEYYDIICHKSTFLTLKSIYLNGELTNNERIEEIDLKIAFYDDSLKQWWTETLNKHNYPFFHNKKTYVSNVYGCIVVI